MCGGTDSAATVKGTAGLTPEQKKNPKPTNTAAEYLEHERRTEGFPIAPPPDAPDITDELVRKRRAAAATQLMLGRGRKASFTTNGYADMQVGKNRLLGGGGDS